MNTLQLTNRLGDRVQAARNLASQGERILENGPASPATGWSRRSEGLRQYDAIIAESMMANELRYGPKFETPHGWQRPEQPRHNVDAIDTIVAELEEGGMDVAEIPTAAMRLARVGGLI